MANQEHPTTEPEQTKTDEWAVFADNPQDVGGNLELLARIEVPRFSQPNADGVALSRDKRLSLAVQRAVESNEMIPNIEGKEFMVMDDLKAPMEFVQYESNPTEVAVWEP